MKTREEVWQKLTYGGKRKLNSAYKELAFRAYLLGRTEGQMELTRATLQRKTA